MSSEVLAIIPARGGSKRIPRKNLRPLLGRPLIAYSIEAAGASKYVTRIVVSTEDEEIEKVALAYGAEVIDRPAELATDDAPTDPAIRHVLDELYRLQSYRPDIVILLQPTSPIRPANLIDDCILRFRGTPANSLFTGFYGPHFAWVRSPGWIDDPLKRKGMMRPLISREARKPRQQMADKDIPFLENGSVFVTDVSEFLKTGDRLCPPTDAFEMPMSHSIDIDEMDHFWEAERILCSPQNGVLIPKAM